MPFKKPRSNEDSTYSGIHLKWFNISELHLFIEYTDILDWTLNQKVLQGSPSIQCLILGKLSYCCNEY